MSHPTENTTALGSLLPLCSTPAPALRLPVEESQLQLLGLLSKLALQSFLPTSLQLGELQNYQNSSKTMEKHSKTLVFSNSSEQKETSSKNHLSQTMHCTKLHHAPPFPCEPCVMKELHPSGRARSYPYLDLGQCYSTV